MAASPRAKSGEFVSATLSGSVFRTPTHFANAAWLAASLASSGEAGVPFQPAGRSSGCSTIFFSCASGAGAADDGAAELLLDVAALLDGAVELALGVEGDLAEEVQAASSVTAHPTAQTGMRREIRMTRDISPRGYRQRRSFSPPASRPRKARSRSPGSAVRGTATGAANSGCRLVSGTSSEEIASSSTARSSGIGC